MMFGIVLFVGLLFGGCVEKDLVGLLGDEMIEKVVSVEIKFVLYYVEGVMKVWLDEKLSYIMYIKEWVDGEIGCKCIEIEENGYISYVVNDGMDIIIYEKEIGMVYLMNVLDMG